MILWKMKEEADRLRREMNFIVSHFGPFPAGKLICTKNSHYNKYYQSDGHNRMYISNDKIDLAILLAAKEYYDRLETKYNHIQKMIAYYERHIEKDQASIDALFAQDSGYRPLLESVSDTQDFSGWAREDYLSNPYRPENKKFRTQTGVYVRSKSEKIIADTLTAYQIPYRYEAALYLDYTIYPDFTIRNPETGDIYYYEHFGMVDDPDYRRKMLDKLDMYMRYGIFDLLYTIETKDRPITVEQIENALRSIYREPCAQAS